MNQPPKLNATEAKDHHSLSASHHDDSNTRSKAPGEEMSELSSALTMRHRPDAPTVRRVIEFLNHVEETAPEPLNTTNTPWTLQRFFDGEIDLDAELAQRFPNAKMLSTIHFRSMGSKSKRGVATLTSPDGSGQMIVDVDGQTRQMQISVTYGAMLTLRFTFDQLGDAERLRWVELMRRKEGGLAFLWGPTRWEHDYMICVSRRYFANFYIFSPRNFEAAIRLTPDVMKSLINWLDGYWKESSAKDNSAPLLTW